MTRLFLRFYLGVIAILIVAWLIHGFVFRERFQEENMRVVEQALSGGVRLAQQRMLQPKPESQSWDDKLATVQGDFEYPVNFFSLSDDWIDATSAERLGGGDVVYFGSHIGIAFPDGKYGLIFGPLPNFLSPSQTEIMFGYGVVFFFAAIAIAVLLRPVVSQLRAVERTAMAIAQGDLSARIDSTRSLSKLPLANAFNTMADRTESLLRSQRELLQAVSHELRTPLARIRFATDLIETAKDDQERRVRLSAVDNATQALDDLVGELLTYVRLESEAGPSHDQQVDVAALIHDTIDMHTPLHPNVSFEFDGSDGPPVTADGASLSRAVGNLLGNAGRFANSIVQVEVKHERDRVVIQVDDDGEGISEHDREKVLQPFVRLDNNTESGSGLGLALVQRIANSHGGSLSVSDSPAGGARFQLELPAA